MYHGNILHNNDNNKSKDGLQFTVAAVNVFFTYVNASLTVLYISFGCWAVWSSYEVTLMFAIFRYDGNNTEFYTARDIAHKWVRNKQAYNKCEAVSVRIIQLLNECYLRSVRPQQITAITTVICFLLFLQLRGILPNSIYLNMVFVTR